MPERVRPVRAAHTTCTDTADSVSWSDRARAHVAQYTRVPASIAGRRNGKAGGAGREMRASVGLARVAAAFLRPSSMDAEEVVEPRV